MLNIDGKAIDRSSTPTSLLFLPRCVTLAYKVSQSLTCLATPCDCQQATVVICEVVSTPIKVVAGLQSTSPSLKMRSQVRDLKTETSLVRSVLPPTYHSNKRINDEYGDNDRQSFLKPSMKEGNKNYFQQVSLTSKCVHLVQPYQNFVVLTY